MESMLASRLEAFRFLRAEIEGSVLALGEALVADADR